MTEKRFPIFPTCSQCGHRGAVYVNNETVLREMEACVRDNALVLWRPLIVRRMLISWLAAFALGMVIGWSLGL